MISPQRVLLGPTDTQVSRGPNGPRAADMALPSPPPSSPPPPPVPPSLPPWVPPPQPPPSPPPLPPPLPPPGLEYWSGTVLVPRGGVGQGSRFGWAVSSGAVTTLVGAPYDSNRGVNAGAAYLFDLSTGRLSLALEPEDPQPGGEFGSSVALPIGTHALDDALNFALVGAPKALTAGIRAGAAYLFAVATGRQVIRLVADDRAGGDEFGFSVALYAGRAIVGARLHTHSGQAMAGAVYIFDCATGVQQRKLVSSSVQALARFGSAVSAHAGLLVVGAPNEGATAAGSGAAHVFDIVTGDVRQRLVSPFGANANGARFGSSVATFQGAAIVGSPQHASGRGAAHLFRHAAVSNESSTIVEDGGKSNDFFGTSVALSTDVALIGAPGAHSQNGLNSGYGVLLHGLSGASYARRLLVAVDGDVNDNFGISSAVSGDAIVLGADAHINSGDSASIVGSVYLFRPAPSPPPPSLPPSPFSPPPALFAPPPAPPPSTTDSLVIIAAISVASFVLFMTVSLACYLAVSNRQMLQEMYHRFSKRGARTLPHASAASAGQQAGP